jgi:hypothetical protein
VDVRACVRACGGMSDHGPLPNPLDIIISDLGIDPDDFDELVRDVLRSEGDEAMVDSMFGKENIADNGHVGDLAALPPGDLISHERSRKRQPLDFVKEDLPAESLGKKRRIIGTAVPEVTKEETLADSILRRELDEYIADNDPGDVDLAALQRGDLMFYERSRKRRPLDFVEADLPTDADVPKVTPMTAEAGFFEIISEYCDKSTSPGRKDEITAMLQHENSPLWRDHEMEHKLFVRYGNDFLCVISDLHERNELGAPGAWYNKLYELKKGNIDDVREFIVLLRNEYNYNVLNVPAGKPDLDALGMLLCSYVGYLKAASPGTLSVDEFSDDDLKRIYHHMGFDLPLNLAKFGQTADIRDLKGYGGATTLGDLYSSLNINDVVIERADAFIALVYKNGVNFVDEPLILGCRKLKRQIKKEIFEPLGLVYGRQITSPPKQAIYDAFSRFYRRDSKWISEVRFLISQDFSIDKKEVTPEVIDAFIRHTVTMRMDDVRSGMCGKST